MDEKKPNYDRGLLYVFGGILIIGALVSAIEGTGTTNYIAKFLSETEIGNSSITDSGTAVNVLTELYENGSRVCTATNGECPTGNSTGGSGNVTSSAANSGYLAYFTNTTNLVNSSVYQTSAGKIGLRTTTSIVGEPTNVAIDVNGTALFRNWVREEAGVTGTYCYWESMHLDGRMALRCNHDNGNSIRAMVVQPGGLAMSLGPGTQIQAFGVGGSIGFRGNIPILGGAVVGVDGFSAGTHKSIAMSTYDFPVNSFYSEVNTTDIATFSQVGNTWGGIRPSLRLTASEVLFRIDNSSGMNNPGTTTVLSNMTGTYFYQNSTFADEVCIGGVCYDTWPGGTDTNDTARVNILNATLESLTANITSIGNYSADEAGLYTNITHLQLSNTSTNTRINQLNTTKSEIGTVSCGAGEYLQNITLDDNNAPTGQCYTDQTGGGGGTSFEGFNMTTYTQTDTTITSYFTLLNQTLYLSAASIYEIDCMIVQSSIIATTGVQLRFNTTGSPSVVSYTGTYYSAAAAETVCRGTNTASNACSGTGTTGVSTTAPSYHHFYVQTNGGASVFTVEMRTEVDASAANVHAGSYCKSVKYA